MPCPLRGSLHLHLPGELLCSEPNTALSFTWQTAPSSTWRTALSVIAPIFSTNCRPFVLSCKRSTVLTYCPRTDHFVHVWLLIVLVLVLVITNPFIYIQFHYYSVPPPPPHLLNRVQCLSFLLISDPDSRCHFLCNSFCHFLFNISSPSASVPPLSAV
jgi:hypothetical protein